MKSENITTRIQKIKSQIARAGYETAFDHLEQLIIDIEGVEKVNADETDLLNQLILIRSRYNAYNDKKIAGTLEDGSTEVNQITQSMLLLTDKVHAILDENPHYLVPHEEKVITADLSIETEDIEATHPITAIATPTNNTANNPGCLFSFSKSADQTNVDVQGSPLRLLAGLGMFLIAGAVGFWIVFTTMSGNWSGVDKPTPPTTTKPPIVDTIGKTDEPEKNTRIIAASDQWGDDLEQLADALASKSEAGRTFKLPQVAFEKNSTRLTPAAKAELDDLLRLLEQVPTLSFTISAGIGEGEANDDNKEITLDQRRAKAVKDYLLDKGIPVTRMEFEGDGVFENGQEGVNIRF